MYIKVQAEFAGDKNASGLEVVCPMPQEVQRVTCDYEREPKPAGSQSWDWQEKAHRIVWKFKRVQGGSTHVLRVSALLTPSRAHCRAVSGRPCSNCAHSEELQTLGWIVSSMSSVLADAGDHDGWDDWCPEKGRGANQPSIHHTHVLCLKAASTISADHEGGEELQSIPLGSLCDHV